MKIRYVHIADPSVEKIHDTVKSLRGSIGLIHALGSEKTQVKWDEEELARFDRDFKKGLIISYTVIEGSDGP